MGAQTEKENDGVPQNMSNMQITRRKDWQRVKIHGRSNWRRNDKNRITLEIEQVNNVPLARWQDGKMARCLCALDCELRYLVNVG